VKNIALVLNGTKVKSRSYYGYGYGYGYGYYSYQYDYDNTRKDNKPFNIFNKFKKNNN
jgi:hypothetical protein